jgi:hypothetical protein
MLAHCPLEPISNEEFESKIAKLRSSIKEMLQGISMQGLDNNLWHSL